MQLVLLQAIRLEPNNPEFIQNVTQLLVKKDDGLKLFLTHKFSKVASSESRQEHFVTN